MKFELRKNLNGSHYYRFSYYDQKTKKQTHLTKSEIRKRFGRDIVQEADAEECLKLLSAKFEADKIRIRRRLDWQEKYYSFTKLADLYDEKQKKRAPNSWQNNSFYPTSRIRRIKCAPFKICNHFFRSMVSGAV